MVTSHTFVCPIEKTISFVFLYPLMHRQNVFNRVTKKKFYAQHVIAAKILLKSLNQRPSHTFPVYIVIQRVSNISVQRLRIVSLK